MTDNGKHVELIAKDVRRALRKIRRIETLLGDLVELLHLGRSERQKIMANIDDIKGMVEDVERATVLKRRITDKAKPDVAQGA